jgi:hypothetical protein
VGLRARPAITQRATPNKYCKYKTAILLYKNFNNQIPYEEWLELNFLQINMSRQNNFMIKMSGNTSVGHNILTIKFHCLNGQIPLD